MGTKSTTQTTNAYNPQGMSAYNQMTPAMSQLNTQFMNQPFSNPQFQMQQLMGNQQANALNQTRTSGLMQNMLGSGMAGGASNPAATEMMQNQARAGTNLQSQLGFMQPVNNALQRQQQALGTAAGYSPLQTGNTQVKSQSGLGTWLPQVASMAAGIGLAPFTGGMSLGMLGGGMGGLGGLFGGGGGGGMAGLGGVPQSMPGGGMGDIMNQNPWMTGNQGFGVPGGGYGGGGGMMPWFNQGGY